VGFVVVYDASVLYPSTVRDLLIRIAQAGLVQARWTEQILDEMFAALRRNRPDLESPNLDRTRALMATAVRDWRVQGYEALIDSLKLPDPDDRHVLAAAIRARAQVIVTANLLDFPPDILRTWDIDPKSPDEFVRDQIDLDRGAVYASVQQIADSWQRPPGTVDDVLDRLERAGLALTVADLRGGAVGLGSEGGLRGDRRADGR
jgi:predicted nucleic acid-binding protein